MTMPNQYIFVFILKKKNAPSDIFLDEISLQSEFVRKPIIP